MRRHFDLIKRIPPISRNHPLTDLKQLAGKGTFLHRFRKIYFFLWTMLVLVDLIWATSDLIHWRSLNLFYSRPVIYSNQDLADFGEVAGTQTILPPTSPSPQPTPSPEVSSAPIMEKSQVTISILNGSGKKGAATALKKELERTDFAVSSVGTAKKIYNNTLIYYKDSRDKAKLVQEALVGREPELQQSSATGKYDILIVVGKK